MAEAASKVRYADEREGIVARLESMLERARNGELTAIAIVASYPDAAVSTCFKITHRGNVWMLLGGIADMQHRLLEDCVGDKE